MQHAIEITYLASSSVAMLALYPQVRQLLALKRSEELSISTWIAWMGYQIIALVYALSIQAPALVFVNIAWIASYVIVITLIIHYRLHPAGPALREEPVPVENGE